MPNKGKFVIIPDTPSVDSRRLTNDDIIIATAKGTNSVLVTNDIGMTVKADVQGVKCETFKNEEVSDQAFLYTGRQTLIVSDSEIDLLYRQKFLDCDANSLIVNQFLILQSEFNKKKSALAYFNGYQIKLLEDVDTTIPNLFKPKNAGQKFLVKALTAPSKEIPLVIVRGAAGTGKTLAALAAGLHGVEKGLYNKVLLLRPNVKFEEDIGYLPGTELEKIDPLLRPFKDNLEILLPNNKEPAKEMEKLFEKGILNAESLAYIRGRSIANTFIIVDEGQNSTPVQTKSIITRAGLGSKIVIIGDPDQIDNPKLNKYTNGLVYASDKMRGSSLCMQLVLDGEECVRCPLALDAVKRMEKR